MKHTFNLYSIIFMMLLIITSCAKKNPEVIVQEMYDAAYGGNWDKLLPYITPDNIDSLNENDINLIAEEFNRYLSDSIKINQIEVKELAINENKTELTYTATVSFSDGTNFTEKGKMQKGSDETWKLVDLMPSNSKEKPFEITEDIPLDFKSNMKRAMIIALAEKGLPQFQYYAAFYNIYDPYPVNIDKYKEYLNKAVEQGNIAAINELRNKMRFTYFLGSYDEDEYVRLTQKGAELGDLECQMGIAWDMMDGDKKFNIPKDREKAKEIFEKGLGAGLGEGGWGLGYMYGNGKIGKSDRQKGLEYYKKGAELGHPGAMYNLGLYYEKGYGTPRDKEEAKKWYIKSYEQGFVYGVWETLSFARNEPENYFKMINNAIKNGVLSNYSTLGECYEFGKGTPQNIEKAKEAYKKDAARISEDSKKSAIRMRGFEKNPVIPMSEFAEIYK